MLLLRTPRAGRAIDQPPDDAPVDIAHALAAFAHPEMNWNMMAPCWGATSLASGAFRNLPRR